VELALARPVEEVLDRREALALHLLLHQARTHVLESATRDLGERVEIVDQGQKEAKPDLVQRQPIVDPDADRVPIRQIDEFPIDVVDPAPSRLICSRTTTPQKGARSRGRTTPP
jgi:hypothetical protein